MRLCIQAGQRRGAAAVEFAVLSIPMVLLLAGVWEVGRLIDAHNILTNAAREGGRQAATGIKSTTQVEDAIKSYCTLNGIDITDISITITNLTEPARIDPRDAVQLDHYQITVTLPFANVKWALIPQITPTTTMTVTVDWYSMKDLPLEVTPDVPVE